MAQLSRMSLLVPVFTALQPWLEHALSVPKVRATRVLVGEDVAHDERRASSACDPRPAVG